MQERQVAKRLFAKEVNDSSLEIESSERNPFFLVTPMGEKVNRVFGVGVLTEKDDISKDPNSPFFRARVSDPTGIFFVNAGKYEMEVVNKLKEIHPPKFLAFIGKVDTYRPEENDNVLVSVRAEEIAVVNEKQRDEWVVDAAESLLERLELYKKISEYEEVDDDIISELKENHDDEMVDNIVLAMEHYDPVDIDAYTDTIRDSLMMVHPDFEPVNRSESSDVMEESELEAQKQKLIRVIKDMTMSYGHKLDETDVLNKMQELHGTDPETFQFVLKALRSEGTVYEPVMGCVSLV